MPKTLDEAADRVLSVMDEKSKLALATAPEGDLILVHCSLGMWTRNAFGLWGGNNELRGSIRRHVAANAREGEDGISLLWYSHPDSLSGVIIHAARERFRSRSELGDCGAEGDAE